MSLMNSHDGKPDDLLLSCMTTSVVGTWQAGSPCSPQEDKWHVNRDWCCHLNLLLRYSGRKVKLNTGPRWTLMMSRSSLLLFGLRALTSDHITSSDSGHQL